MTFSTIKCRVTRNQDGTWNVLNVPTFMSHTRGDMIYDRAWLQKIVENTSKSDRIKGRPRIIVHHSGDYTGPNVGRLANLRLVEDVILADYTNIRPAVFMNMHKDGYPARSVQLDPRTFDRIEAVALLGDEEAYFPFAPIEFDLTAEQEAQLLADVEADKAFAHAYSRSKSMPKGKKSGAKKPAGTSKKPMFIRRADAARIANFMLENPDADAVEIEKLFERDDKGALKQYMLEPEDAQDVIAIMDELVAPIKEGLAMVVTRLEAVEQLMDSEESRDDADDFEREEGDGSEDSERDQEEGEEDSMREEDDEEADSERDEDDESEEDSERDDDESGEEDSEREEDEEDMSKRNRPDGKKPAKKTSKQAAPQGDLADFRRLVEVEAENYKHRGAATFSEFKRKIQEALDPAIEPEPEAKADEWARRIFKLKPEDRQEALDLLLDGMQEGAVPTGKLPTTRRTREEGGKSVEQRAREYHREYQRVMGRKYNGMTEDEFAKHVTKTVEENPDGNSFAFLRG